MDPEVPSRGGGSRVPRLGDALLLTVANVIWGSTYVVSRAVLDTSPPLVLAFARSALAAAGLLLLLRVRAARSSAGVSDKPRPLSPEDRRLLALVGVTGFGLSRVLYYEGLARSTAHDAALIINLEAVFTAVAAAWLLGQRLWRLQWLGVAVACVGGALLVLPSPGETQAASRSFGNLLMVAAVVVEALGTVFGARAMERLSGLQVTAVGSYWGTLVLLLPAWWQWHADSYSLSWVTPGNLVGVLYLALAATVFAYTAWYQVLSRVDAGAAATFLYLQPLVGVALSILILNTWPNAVEVAGGGLVLLGIYLTGRVR